MKSKKHHAAIAGAFLETLLSALVTTFAVAAIVI
jgi:hypothetical protein